MYVVPTISQLAAYSGRPEPSYTTFANSALLQATLIWTTLTEVTDPSALDPDDQMLADNGILAYADWIYLRQPYQQAIAGPFTSESIGSYSYAKAAGEVARNAQATEVIGESTGVVMFDLSVRMLARRTRAGGVFTGQVEVFENGSVRFDNAGVFLDVCSGNLVLRGPDEFNLIPATAYAVNAESFPIDPGLG